MAYKKSNSLDIYERCYGDIAGEGWVNPGFELESRRRPLWPMHGRKVHWGLAVVKKYLEGIRKHQIPTYPDEATYRPPRFRVLGGPRADRRKNSGHEGRISR